MSHHNILTHIQTPYMHVQIQKKLCNANVQMSYQPLCRSHILTHIQIPLNYCMQTNTQTTFKTWWVTALFTPCRREAVKRRKLVGEKQGEGCYRRRIWPISESSWACPLKAVGGRGQTSGVDNCALSIWLGQTTSPLPVVTDKWKRCSPPHVSDVMSTACAGYALTYGRG